MEKKIVTCDKCGKDISENEVNQRFKISIVDRLYAPKSAYVDICSACMKDFFDGLKLDTLRYFEDLRCDDRVNFEVKTEVEIGKNGLKKKKKKRKKC